VGANCAGYRSSVTRDDKLRLAERIAREFIELGMKSYLPPLRAYYRAVRDGRPTCNWDDELVVDWATALRVAPYENAVEVRPVSSRCGCNERHDSQRPMVFPLGWLVTCLACGRRWLETSPSKTGQVRSGRAVS
jgi:hypothetical protein